MPPKMREAVATQAFHLDIARSEVVTAMGHPHRHHEVEVNYLEAGEVVYLIGGAVRRVDARKFCFFWGSIPHRLIEVSPSARGFWYVTIPLAWILEWQLPPALLGKLLDGELLFDRRACVGDSTRLSDWQGAIHNDDVRYQRPAILEIEARFRRFALDNTLLRSRSNDTSAVVPRKVEQLARYIVEHFRAPLTLADIAAAAGLHPNYAANLFRKHCGQTLLQCLNQHRIAHAQRVLATTPAKVIDVAAESGFGSLSRFYEAFVHACRETPSAYRKRFAT